MLARDVEIADIDGRHWDNWLRLLLPPGAIDDPRFAMVWIDGDQVIKAVVRGQGARPPGEVPFAGTSDEALAALAAALGVGAVVVFERGAIEALFAGVDSQLRFDDDYVAQGLVMLRELKALAGEGIWSHPRLLEIVPVPPFEALQRTFDLLVPDGSAMVAYVIEDDRSDVHASIIATKVDGHVDQVATHKALEDALPGTQMARGWRGQHKRVLELVEERFAKPSVALFMERAAYYRVLTGPTDTLTREIRARHIVIDPAPTWLLGLLGGATVAAMASRGARAMASLLPESARQMATSLAKQARDVAQSSSVNPWGLLGFDPIELWLRLRHLYRPAA